MHPLCFTFKIKYLLVGPLCELKRYLYTVYVVKLAYFNSPPNSVFSKISRDEKSQLQHVLYAHYF